MALSTCLRLLVAAGVVSAAAAAVSPPACQLSGAPPQPVFNVTTGNLTVPGFPFGLVYASDKVAFTALANGDILLLNTSAFVPSIVRQFSIPSPYYETGYAVGALTITSDKHDVYVSVEYGAAIFRVEDAVAGKADPFVGFLNGTAGNGSIQTTLSRDDKYAFVSQEYGNNATGNHGAVEVFRMHRMSNGSVSSTYVGFTTLEYAVVGTALSRDGSKLFVTSESTVYNNISEGTLSVLDVATLKTDPSKALINSVSAGCSPVRDIVSHDGKYVWLTARESNKLLAFDAVKLVDKNTDALVASVEVGTSPVGLRFVKGGRYIVTADSNRFNYGNVTGLSVVDVEAVLNGSQSSGFPRISTGLFPRELAVSPDRKTLLVVQYMSRAIQSVNLTQLT